MKTSYLYAFVAAIFWGLGFIGSRFALEESGPIWVTFMRFAIAFVVFLPVIKFIKRKDFSVGVLKHSLICSVFLALIITLQVSGLQYTSVAKSGFITILYAFFTPLLCYFLYRKKISNFYWNLLLVSLIGMFMISDFSISSLNYGDFLTLLCALTSAFHIICVSHFCSKYNLFLFNLLQLGFVSALLLPVAYIVEGSPEFLFDGSLFLNTAAMWGLIFMGIFSTCLAFYLQLKAQERLPAHCASLIFLLESPIAAVLGFFVFSESLSLLAFLGCLLVTVCVGILIVEEKLSNLRINVILPRREGLVWLSLLVIFIALFI